MDESSDKNTISDWSEVPLSELPVTDFKNNESLHISELTIPLPDIPALSIPDEPIVPTQLFPAIMAREDVQGANDIIDGDEPEDEYLLMDNNDGNALLISHSCIASPSPFTSLPPAPPAPPPPAPPPPPFLQNSSNNETVNISPTSYSPEPYETPLALVTGQPDFSSPSPLLPPLSPPILPPPSPPSHPPQQMSTGSARHSIPSSVHYEDDEESSSTYEDITSSNDGHEDGIMYEELNTTHDGSDPSLYVDMLAEPPEPSTTYAGVESIDDPTYDDIPGQAILQESRIEILPSGQVHATMMRTQGDGFTPSNPAGPITVVENEQGVPPTLTSFNGLIDDAPPSYNALFGAPPPSQQIPQPVPVIQQAPLTARPTVDVHVVGDTNLPRSPTHSSNDDHWCLGAVNKSPLRTGIYLFIFLLGIFVPLGTLGLGIGLFLTTSTEDNMTSIYLIVIGSFSSFFVCWHTTALIVGAYIKAHNVPKRHSVSSCCMRLFHCGAWFWWGAIGYLSYRIWPEVVSKTITFDILTIVMLGFLTFQYLMTLYCCIEALVDCRGCLKDRMTRRDDFS